MATTFTATVERCINVIENNVNKELHIAKNNCRLNIFNYCKENNFQEIICTYVSIYHSLLNSCKSASELTIKYYKKCLEQNEIYEISVKCERQSNRDLCAVLNFFANTVFNIMQDEHQSIGAGAIKKRRFPVIQGITTNNAEETERGLYCIGGGTLCDIFKKARGKRMYRNSLNRCRPARKNIVYICIISAIKMTSVEKQNIPAFIYSCLNRLLKEMSLL